MLILAVCLFGCGIGTDISTESDSRSADQADSSIPKKERDDIEKAEEVKTAENDKKADGAILADDSDIEVKANEILAKMTMEEKLAQMIIVALRSDPQNTYLTTEITPVYSEFLSKYGFGGVILYAKNLVDARQTRTMINDIQIAALEAKNNIPMFVCVDQEGGMVNRISFGSVTSGSMALSATGDLSNTEKSADIIGRELSALGFNVDFAPDCDINSNPSNPIIGVRSFSDDPSIVAEHTKAFIKGITKNKVVTSLKHFPGHGDVDVDSHLGLPKSDITLEELRERELIPFKAGIELGTDMIMTAHIQYPNIEKETYYSENDEEDIFLPATLSHKILTDLLRDELGYEGVVITDAIEMGALTDHFDRQDAAIMAINAGADILLCALDLNDSEEVNTFPKEEDFFKGLVDSANQGKIDEDRINESVLRILKLKLKRGIMETDLLENDEDMEGILAEVGSKDNREVQWNITKGAITLLKNDGLLPFDGNNGSKVLVLYPSERRKNTFEYSIERLKKEGLIKKDTISLLCYDGISTDNEALIKEITDTDKVIIMNNSTEYMGEVTKFIDIAHKNDKKVLLLSCSVPYDSAYYNEADAILCAYQYTGDAYDTEGEGPFNLNLAVAFCMAFGESVPEGTLPVNVPQYILDKGGEGDFSDEMLYERGFGLFNWGEK